MRSPPHVRVASALDLDAACALLSEQFVEHDIELSPAALRVAVSGLLDVPSRGAVLLAHDGDAPVGVAVLATTWTLEHGGLVAWLDELYVSPSRRNGGIGKVLLDHAIAHARSLGCIAIELEIDEEHARAAHLYERAGFGRLARTRWSRAIGSA